MLIVIAALVFGFYIGIFINVVEENIKKRKQKRDFDLTHKL
jgi:uncharacterized protein YneF (UPF0154 family)